MAQDDTNGAAGFPDEQDVEVAERSAGISPLFSLFIAAMDRNWAALQGVAEFPRATRRAGASEKAPSWPDVAGMQTQAMASMMSSWKMFGDAVQGAFDVATKGQDAASEQFSQALATGFRAFTGLDPRDMLNGVDAGWSPQQVAVRSFAFGDSDMVAISGEMAQLIGATSESTRAALNLYRIMSDAWLKAAGAFQKSYAARTDPADPAELPRAWVQSVEPILQDVLRSPSFVEAQARVVRTASRQARARTALAKRFSDFIEVPHRQEMNETYEAIQELRREVRTLRRNQARLERALEMRSAPEPAEGE